MSRPNLMGDSLMTERFFGRVQPEPTSGCWLWTGAKVDQIRALRAAGVPGIHLAAQFGISPSHVSGITHRVFWS